MANGRPPTSQPVRDRTLPAMSRFSHRLWAYPPRAPSPPPIWSPPRGTLPFRVRTRTWPFVVSQPADASDCENTGAPEASLGTAFIHGLPPEILVQIFNFVAELHNGSAAAYHIHHIRGIAHLMLVCRRWRLLIIDTSIFWRHIAATRNLDWVSLCLERARECTLDLQVFRPGCDDEDALALIVPHASRIRSLSAFLCTEKQRFEILRPFFTAGLPALERLEIGQLRDSKHNYGGGRVDFALQRATTPRLQSLKIDNVILPPPKHFWRSLRVLKLSSAGYLSGEPPGTYTMVHLLHVLAQNPLLQELDMPYLPLVLYPVPSAESREDHGEARNGAAILAIRAHLPNLHTLAVGGSSGNVATLLDYLSFPADIANIDIRVGMLEEDSTAEMVSDSLLPAFRPVLERMTEVELTGGYDWITRICSPSPTRRLSSTTKLVGYIRFSFTGSMQPAPLETRLRGLVRALSAAPVRTLTIKVAISLPARSGWTGSEAVAAAFWTSVLDAFPSLERLCILVLPTDHFRLNLVELIHALRPSCHKRETREASERLGPLRCPLLIRLSVHGRFGNDAEESLEVLEALLDCARGRASAGVAFGELDIHFWYQHWEAQPLSEAHRSVLAQIRGFVESMVCKFGLSPGCMACHW